MIDVEVTGGARIGLANATWPLAKLRASSRGLTLSVSVFGEYAFTPADVVGLEPFGMVPIVGRGVKILHNRADYPAHIVFWYLGDPSTVIRRVLESGFKPEALAETLPVANGIPVRLSALVVPVIAWNVLLLLDFVNSDRLSPGPGVFTWLAVALAFIFSIVVSRSDQIQRTILRDGRSFEEIRAPVRLLQFVSGVMLAAMTISFLT